MVKTLISEDPKGGKTPSRHVGNFYQLDTARHEEDCTAHRLGVDPRGV
jgi:hypothetical protein